MIVIVDESGWCVIVLCLFFCFFFLPFFPSFVPSFSPFLKLLTNIIGVANYDNHKRPDLVSFDDINYNDLNEVQKARSSMTREQWIKTHEIKITHEALRKCKRYHGDDAQRNCRPLILKYMKMIETTPLQGYLGYQKNDPSQ